MATVQKIKDMPVKHQSPAYTPGSNRFSGVGVKGAGSLFPKRLPAPLRSLWNITASRWLPF